MNIVGSKWWKFDFHTHTPNSCDYGKGDKSLTFPQPKEWLNDYIAAGIECVAVTDHNSGDGIDSLKIAAEEIFKETNKKIHIFPGLEITASGNVHILGIFDPSKTGSEISAIVGAAGYRGQHGQNETVSDKSALEVIKEIKKFGGIAIPAHIDRPAGLCTQDARTITSILEEIHAVEIIFPNKENDKYPLSKYKNINSEKPSVIGSDSHHPNDVGRGYTWVKMSTPSIDGLKLALIDGNTSIKRFDDLQENENPNQYSSTLLHSIQINNAKYAGRKEPLQIDFNPWMNSIIGGRGSGKSSILEFIRIGMDRSNELSELAADNELKRTFESFKKSGNEGNDEGVMLPNTNIMCMYIRDGLYYQTHWDNSSNQVKISRWDGNQWTIEPGDVKSRFPIKIYSQKQIFELAKNPNSLLKLIDESSNVNYQQWIMEWNEKKSHFNTLRNRQRELQVKLQYKPTLQGQLFDINNKIKTIENSGHSSIFEAYNNNINKGLIIHQIINGYQNLLEEMNKFHQIEINLSYLSILDSNNINEKPLLDLLNQLDNTVKNSSNIIQQQSSIIRNDLNNFINYYSTSPYMENSNKINLDYQNLNSKFNEENIENPDQYHILLTQRDMIEKNILDLDETEKENKEINSSINILYNEIVNLRKKLTQNRASFIKTNLKDNNAIEIKISPLADERDIERDFRKKIHKNDNTFVSDIYDTEKETGILYNLNQIINESGDLNDINEFLDKRYEILNNFKSQLYKYEEGTILNTKLSKRFIDYFSQLPPSTIDDLILWFPEDKLTIKFYDGKKFKDVSQGSAGQKASAILSFLLSYGTEPLILDQPEDDLDNGLITSLIVKKLNENKHKRQIIVITHNPNIVVNGDSEYVVSLKGHGQIMIGSAGALQDAEVRQKVCEIMEGGEIALKQRYRRMIP